MTKEDNKNKEVKIEEGKTYCFDIKNEVIVTWAGSGVNTCLHTIRDLYGNGPSAFREIPPGLLLFKSNKTEKDVREVENANEIEFGKLFYYRLGNAFFGMTIRNQNKTEGGYYYTEMPDDRKTYMQFIKSAFQNKQIYAGGTTKKPEEIDEKQIEMFK